MTSNWIIEAARSICSSHSSDASYVGRAQRRRRLSPNHSGRSLRIEDLEGRRLMTATGFAGNECAPDLDLSAITARTANVGQAFSLNLLTSGGTIEDLNTNGSATNNVIRYLLDPDADDTPAGATISSTGVFSWTPTAAQVGSHSIVVISIDTGTPPLADAETFVINVVAAAPVVDLNGSAAGTGFTASFTENGTALLIVDTDLSVTSTGNLNAAVVRITNRADGSAETLSVDTTGVSAITQAFNSSTGILTLTGQATAAQYQQVLRTLRYINSSQNPGTTARSVEVTVTAGTGASAITSSVATSTVSVVAVNDPPNLAAIANQNAGVGSTFEITVTATDAEGNPVTFTFDRDDPSGNIPASATIVQTGNTALIRWVVDQAGTFNFVVLVTETGAGGLADRETFTLTTTSAAPVVDLNGSATGTGFSATFVENGSPLAIVDTDATVTDANSTNLQSATITLQNRPDGAAEVLSITPAGGATFTYNSTTGVLAITGSASVADYQSMLRSLTYRNTSDDPDPVARTVRVVISDGTNSSLAADATIQVTPVADAPQLVVPSEFTSAASPFTVTSGMTVSFVATATDAESTASELGFSLDLTGSGIVAADPQPTISSPPSAVPGGSFSWAPTRIGEFSFDVVATDPSGQTARTKIHILVAAPRPALSVKSSDSASEDASQGSANLTASRMEYGAQDTSDELPDSMPDVNPAVDGEVGNQAPGDGIATCSKTTTGRLLDCDSSVAANGESRRALEFVFSVWDTDELLTLI